MKLNNDKFEYISFKLFNNNSNTTLNLLKELPFKDSTETYLADGMEIFPSGVVRDLGVLFNENLDWQNHYSKLYVSSKQTTGWILNTFHSRDRETMLTLFKALVRSRLEFCCEVWNPYLKKDIVLIERVQRWFTYKISGMKELNYWERLKELKLLSLQRRRERMILIHVWKIKNGFYPNSAKFNFKFHNRTAAFRIVLRPLSRVKGKLLSLFENSFIINAAKLWNSLPGALTCAESLNSFVHQLKLYFSKTPDQPPLPGYPFANSNSLTEQCLRC